MVGKSSKRLVLLIPNSESHYGWVLFPTVTCCGHSGSQELAVEGGGRRRLIHMFRFKQRMTTQSLGQSTFEECVIRRSFSGSPGTFQRHLQCWQYQGPVYGSIYDPTDVVGLAVGTAKWAKKATDRSWQICFSFLNMWRIIQFSQYVENYSVSSIICGELNLRLPFARTGGKWQVDNPSFLREPVLPQSTVASHRPSRLVWEFNSQQLPAKHREDMSKWEFKSQLQIRIVSSIQMEKTRMTWEEGDRSENGPIQGNWPDLRILEVSLPWFTSIYLNLPWFIPIYPILPIFTSIYTNLPWFTSTCINLPCFTSIYLDFNLVEVRPVPQSATSSLSLLRSVIKLFKLGVILLFL